MNTVGGVDRFDYNLNGSMSVRKTGVVTQTLRWDSRNQLAQVTWGSPVQNEYYGYDEGGRRVAKAFVSGGSTVMTYYPFAHYEQTGSSSAGVTKYYFFGGERFAMRTGSGAGVLRLLFKDHLSSTVHVTDGAGNQVAGRGYYAFGATMRSTGTMPTDHLFTDQQLDASGLYYYGARYYDSTIGHFISPDTLLPDPANVMDYRRYLYGYGNPVKYSDPSGYCATRNNSQPDENDQECWQWAYTIWAQWDTTDYWQKMWPDGKDHFINNVASQPIQADFFDGVTFFLYFEEVGHRVS